MQRRHFLKSSAGLYLVLPLLEGLLSPEEARAQEGVKPFLVTMRNGCGREDSKFWQSSDGPIQAGANKGMSVESLSPYFAKMLFVNGVSPTINRNPNFCSHGIAASNLITCGNYTPAKGGMEAAHEESFDHYLHKKWGGVGSPLVAQLGSEAQGKRHRFSWSAKEQEIPALLNPFEVWKSLFGRDPAVQNSGSSGMPNAEAMIQRGSLNAVLPQLQDMLRNPRLSAKDKLRLEQHLTAVDEFEKKLASLMNQGGTKFGADQALVDALNKHKGRKASEYTADLNTVGDLMMDAIAIAIGSGVTRVATISMGVSIDFVNYRVGKYTDVDFHKSSHANEAGMSEADRHEQLAANDRFFAQRFRRLLDKMSEIPTGGSSLLDYGVCQWLCDMGPHGSFGHVQGNLMHVVAGGGKIGMAQGKKISYQNQLIMTRFLGSIGNALSAPGESGGIMQDFHAVQGQAAAKATGSKLKSDIFTGVAKEMLSAVKS